MRCRSLSTLEVAIRRALLALTLIVISILTTQAESARAGESPSLQKGLPVLEV